MRLRILATLVAALSISSAATAGTLSRMRTKQLTATSRVQHWRTPQTFGRHAQPIVIVRVGRHLLDATSAGRLSAFWYGDGVIVEAFEHLGRGPFDFYVVSIAGRQRVTIRYGALAG